MDECPYPHDVDQPGYCMGCGLAIGPDLTRQPSAAPATPPSQAAGAGLPAGEPDVLGPRCPHCGEPRTEGRFCEACGRPYAAPVGETGPGTLVPGMPAVDPRPVRGSGLGSGSVSVPGPGPGEHGEPEVVSTRSWLVVVSADREFFETTRGAERGFEFPVTAQRRIVLGTDVIKIGRRSRRQSAQPDVDLSAPPADPGVSREHATLLRQPNGGWVLVDSGSANGTFLNGDAERLPRNQLVPVSDGDRIRLGIWTLLTLQRAPWLS